MADEDKRQGRPQFLPPSWVALTDGARKEFPWYIEAKAITAVEPSVAGAGCALVIVGHTAKVWVDESALEVFAAIAKATA